MIQMDAIEKIFGKTAQMTVLKNLIENQNEPTYLSGIAEATGLSHSSVSRVSLLWSRLVLSSKNLLETRCGLSANTES